MGEPVTTEAADTRFAAAVLTPAELGLWTEMDARDRRHSVAVTKRFVAACPGALREEVAGALLHDVGKSGASLGRVGRSVATIVALTPTMRRYRDHERIGAEMLAAVGAHHRTIELVAGTASDAIAVALRAADDA
jgi:putative nucleotidyltransferase with HDIG domain